MEFLKPSPAYRYGRTIISHEEPHDPLTGQLTYVMRAELHMMTYVKMFGQIADIDQMERAWISVCKGS